MTLVRFENFQRRSGRMLLFIFLVGSTASIAHAQVPYDLNCKPVELTESQKINEETCAMHAGCRFLVQAPINAGCKAVNFIRNIGKTDPAFDNNVLIDGATYDLPRQTAFDRLVSGVKTAAHSALGTAGKRDVVQTDDGRVAYYEGGHLDSGSANGAMIYSDGTMARGTFDAKYKLSGSGQLITPDGKVRAGEFKNNQLRGEGFVSDKEGKRTVLIEGTFDGDTPVGEVIRNYADGSRVRELWENGKMVARGDRAAKGKVPPPINRPQTRLASADAKHGLYEVEGPNGSKRWELWCTNLLVDKGGWFPKGHYPQKPERQTCDKKIEKATTDESEFSRGDLIERTLGPSKTKAVGGVSETFNLPFDGGQIYLIIRADAIEVVSVRAKNAKYYAILEQLRTIPSVSPGTYRAPLPNGEFLLLRVHTDRWGKRIDVGSHGLGPSSEQWRMAQ